MHKYSIFSDGSFDPKSRTGIAGFLILKNPLATHRPQEIQTIKTQIFEKTTCSRLELQAAICALHHFQDHYLNRTEPKADLFTDSKTIAGLPLKRVRLEKTEYISKRSNKILNQADLYKDFFILSDQINLNITWTKGHTNKGSRSLQEEIFTLVDKHTRRILREQTLKY